MKKREQKKSWIVRVRCLVVKEIVTEECYFDEAEACPWDHAAQEEELNQIDWNVLSVEPNE